MVKGEVVSPTAILVKWSIVRACSEGDGMVVKYRVHFTAESSGEVQHIDRTEVTKLEASLTGLSPYTNYSIQIATVNEHGVVGRYSYPIPIQTPEDGNNFKVMYISFLSQPIIIVPGVVSLHISVSNQHLLDSSTEAKWSHYSL